MKEQKNIGEGSETGSLIKAIALSALRARCNGYKKNICNS
jgi:hypothetical protein